MDLATGFNTPGSDMCLVFYASMASYTEALSLAESQYVARVEACALLGNEIYCPALSPAEFSGDGHSQYFPMIPGQTLIYEAITPEGLERIESTTLRQLKESIFVAEKCRAHDPATASATGQPNEGGPNDDTAAHVLTN